MNAALFQLNKVRRLVKTQGQAFEFTREQLNDFGEPTDESVTLTIKGVYHETASYLTKTAMEATTIKQKPSPMILCLWEEANKLKPFDVLAFNGKNYTINGVKNIDEANIIGDVSLEEVQTDGNRVQNGLGRTVERSGGN